MSSLYDGFVFSSLVLQVLCFSKFLVCGRFERHSIVDQMETSNQLKFISMLQNCNHMYSSHYKIFKYVSLEPCHYAINLDVVSSISVFSEFGFVSQSNV